MTNVDVKRLTNGDFKRLTDQLEETLEEFEDLSFSKNHHSTCDCDGCKICVHLVDALKICRQAIHNGILAECFHA
jgi:hypothetical protein